MNAVTHLRDLVEKVCAHGQISADDVLALRRQVFPDGVVSPDEARAVFRLDQTCLVKAPEWARFYVDALTDYFVWQSEPRGYVNDALADELIAQITHNGHIDAMSELELLINVIHWCEQCPDALGDLAVQAVKESVLTPGTACFGSNRAPNVIGAEDVALIRRVIYASGSSGGFTVTRHEAELMFELDHATRGEDNNEAWPDVFAKAVVNALMFPRGPRVVPSAEVALRREKWLEDRPGVGALLMSAGKAAARGNIPVRAVFGRRQAKEEVALEERRVAEALSREAVTAEEAAWLIAQIGDAGSMSEGVIRVLRFIKDNSPSIDPALDPVFARAGL